MKQKYFSLVLRTASGRTGMACAEDPQTLRNHGLRHAHACVNDGVLLLLEPNGRALEWFDVWTNQWCASA